MLNKSIKIKISLATCLSIKVGLLLLGRFVVVVALLFYVHGKHLRSCRDGQLT